MGFTFVIFKLLLLKSGFIAKISKFVGVPRIFIISVS